MVSPFHECGVAATVELDTHIVGLIHGDACRRGFQLLCPAHIVLSEGASYEELVLELAERRLRLDLEKEETEQLSWMLPSIEAFANAISKISLDTESSVLLELVQSLSFIDIGISNLLIHRAQVDNRFMMSEDYNPSSGVISLLKDMHGEFRQFELLGEPPIQSITLIRELLLELNVRAIAAHVDYLKLIGALLCVSTGPFCSNSCKAIGNELLNVLKNILQNCRLEKVYVESNLLYGERELGTKTTSKLELFFTQDNSDRYCLRVDFPHEGVGYIHYNLHDPLGSTSFPVRNEKIADLRREGLSPAAIDSLLFRRGTYWWFRSNFEVKLEEMEELSDFDRATMSDLFTAQAHTPILSEDYGSDIMKDFLSELCDALLSMRASCCEFAKTKNVSLNEEFRKTEGADMVRQILHECVASGIMELLGGKSPGKVESEIQKALAYANKIVVRASDSQNESYAALSLLCE